MKSYPYVHQIGFVVENMDKAMEEYGKVYRIKKWYRTPCKPDDDMFFHGKRIVDPGFQLNVGYCGRTEIELITTSATESLYANFLREHGPGLHHISFFTTHLEKSVKEFEAMGFEVVQNGFMTGKDVVTDYAYMAKPDEGYSRIIEFSSSKMYGLFRINRGKNTAWLAALTGNMTRVR